MCVLKGMDSDDSVINDNIIEHFEVDNNDADPGL